MTKNGTSSGENYPHNMTNLTTTEGPILTQASYPRTTLNDDLGGNASTSEHINLPDKYYQVDQAQSTGEMDYGSQTNGVGAAALNLDNILVGQTGDIRSQKNGGSAHNNSGLIAEQDGVVRNEFSDS